MTLVAFGRGNDMAVGRGAVQVHSPAESADPELSERIRGRLSRGQRAFVALGFRPEEPAVVVVPEAWEVTRADELPSPATAPRLLRREYDVDDEAFAVAVEKLLDDLDDRGPLSKVVLGRWLRAWFDAPVSPSALLRALSRRSSRAWSFALPLPDGTSLVGASPELLVNRRGDGMQSCPLAGSAPRHDERSADDSNAARLLSSEKDLREHAHVVDDIRTRLTAAGVRLPTETLPHLLATDSMWHIASAVESLPTDGLADALTLAQSLHPTPAVGGTPREAAMERIGELEPTPRGLMTGVVGWIDSDGDGEFVVTIRSAILDGPRVGLFAGAGIVTGSDPQTEALETAAKLRTVMAALEEL